MRHQRGGYRWYIRRVLGAALLVVSVGVLSGKPEAVLLHSVHLLEVPREVICVQGAYGLVQLLQICYQSTCRRGREK